MSDKINNTRRHHEGEVSKGLPEAAPNAGNAYEEDEQQMKDVKDAPNEQGEIPRKRDDSKDDKKDPFKAS